MPVILQTDASTKFKPSFAPSSNVGLCLRANGDEQVCVIDSFGFTAPARIPVATVTPTCSNGTTSGAMTTGKWVAYVYCYAASRRYPYVEGDSIGGNLYPRGNPSPASAPYLITGNSVNVTLRFPDNTSTINDQGQVRSDVNRVWIFRTIYFDTQKACRQAAAAGDFYYVDVIQVPRHTPPGTDHVYTDVYETPTDDLVEYDNYGAPVFQFCIYVDPYWWGFGNYPLKARASWDSSGYVTFDNTDPNATFYSGRDKQACYLQSTAVDSDTDTITRQYYAYSTGDIHHCQLYTDLEFGLVGDSFTAGSGYLIFNGPSTTLYRSKYRNPMAWGQTEYVGDIRVPSQFFFKVGGGIGTGIAQVPNMPLLVLSTKGPAATYVLDLRTAGTDQFGGSLRTISTLYSVTSHFSQFAAMLANGAMVLYGHDADNKCIIACDGQTVQPVSDPAVSATMRSLSDDPVLQRMVHGLYDPITQHNCLWLPQFNAIDTMNLLVSQSSVNGTWHTQFEGDVLSSAFVESTFCALRKIYLGTEKGMFGIGLDETKTRNWLFEDLTLYGSFNETSQLSTPIPHDAVGLIGSWMLVVDQYGSGDQWGRIASINSVGTIVTVDRCWSPKTGNSNTWIRTPVPGDRYYLGVIEVSMLKYLDFNNFVEDKKLEELWLALVGQDVDNLPKFQYVRDRGDGQVALAQNFYRVKGQSTLIPVKQVSYNDNETSQQWLCQAPPTERTKVFGIRVIDRGYTPLRIFGIGGKIV